MKKQYWIFIGAGVVYIVIMLLLMYEGPKKVNWEPNFSKDSKDPYGSFIVYDRLHDLFTDSVYVNGASTYDLLKSNFIKDSKNSSLLYINNDFSFNKLTAEKLDQFISDGNAVFIAGSNFGYEFNNHFKVFTTYDLGYGSDKQRIECKFLQTNRKYYDFTRTSISSYFNLDDSPGVEVLAVDGKDHAVFVRKRIGKGFLYMATFPHVFTNYHVLNNRNYQLIEDCLSFLPTNSIVWDEYYKVERQRKLQETQSSILSEIKKYDSLKWALGMLGFMLLLAYAFMIKRNQRIIPVIEPPKNETGHFVKIVGRLYYSNNDNKDLALKKITYFFDYLHLHLNVKTHVLDTDFIEQVSAKAAVDRKLVQHIVYKINQIRNNKAVENHLLIELDDVLYQFYHQTKR